MSVSVYEGMANFDENFYVMDAKKGLSGKPSKMLLWTWIFQNGAIFLFIHYRHSKASHICGFDTHMLKVFCFCRNSKFSNLICFQVSLGITYPKFIILGQKFGSRSKKSIFWKKKWKSAKKIKMAISWPLIGLGQNPLGCKVYLGQGSRPCPNCTDIWELKFLLLATF